MLLIYDNIYILTPLIAVFLISAHVCEHKIL